MAGETGPPDRSRAKPQTDKESLSSGRKERMGRGAQRRLCTARGCRLLDSRVGKPSFCADRSAERRRQQEAEAGRPWALGHVPIRLWASGSSRQSGGRCPNGIPGGASGWRVPGPQAVNPGTSRLPLSPTSSRSAPADSRSSSTQRRPQPPKGRAGGRSPLRQRLPDPAPRLPPFGGRSRPVRRL